MKALYFDKDYGLRLRDDLDRPQNSGEALIEVIAAGICRTDLELVKGYMEFTGVPGHEFIGRVVSSPEKKWIGQRVTGEINVGCGECRWCLQGLQNHCSNRTVLGILKRQGAFAQYISLPTQNLHLVPDTITDEAAIFIEPLAAAFEIPNQIPIFPTSNVGVLGDGKLGLLVSQVLARYTPNITAIGKHPEKLSILANLGIKTILAEQAKEQASFDLIVEATGRPDGFELAMKLVRSRGTIVLKSTIAEGIPFNIAPLVIHEITVLGSRCGPFHPAIQALSKGEITTAPLVTKYFPIDKGIAGFQEASRSASLKVILQIQGD